MLSVRDLLILMTVTMCLILVALRRRRISDKGKRGFNTYYYSYDDDTKQINQERPALCVLGLSMFPCSCECG